MIINCINCKENFEFELTSRTDELPLFCHNCKSKFTPIDSSKLLNSKTPIIIPIAWSDDVLNGKTKVVVDNATVQDFIELDTNAPSPEDFDDTWFPKCHICGVQVRDIDGEICDNCLAEVNKRLYEENEKLNEDEYK